METATAHQLEAQLIDKEITYPLRGKRVLLAEDDEVSQQQLFILLSRLGASVKLAEDGEQVLAEMIDCQCDFLVLDMQLPPHNAIELVRELRQVHGNNIPILGISGAAMSGRAVGAGVNLVLRKPLEPKEVQDAVLSLVRV